MSDVSEQTEQDVIAEIPVTRAELDAIMKGVVTREQILAQHALERAERDELIKRLATRDDLEALATKKDLEALVTKDNFSATCAAIEKRLLLEFGRMANSIMEHVSKEIGVIIDRFDGPVREVRADLDAHRKDFSMHKRRAAAPLKRAARRKPAR